MQTLKTKRLILKEITPEDIENYQKGFADYEVIRHMNGRVPWPFPKDGVKTFLESEIFPNLGQTIWQWGIFLKERPDILIGSISLRKSDVDNRGFWLARAYWGQGYMTEAVNCINQYAFEELGFKILRFTNAKGNHRSRRIKEKTGAHLVKVTPMKAVDPQYTDQEHWELTKTDWIKGV